MKQKPVVIGLALAALFFAILLPPEAYPDGRLAVILCSTFAFFVSLAERRVHSSYILGGMALFGLLLVHSVFVSIDLYRSIEFMSVLWAYYCLLGFFLYAGFDPVKPLAISLVALSVIVSAYGLYQYFWGFEQLYNYVSYAGTDDVIKIPALQRIATGRVFSTLALPGTLWGFLTVALPFHASLWKASRILKGALSVSVAMLLATGLLTRSFGFLVGLFVLAAAWLFYRHRRLLWNRLTVVVVILILVAGAFYSARRSAIAGANPASLRAMNWITAWTIFAAHPMGTGLNTYGVAYSQYMLPGANATQYAHNTPLQLLSELGYPALIAGAVLLLWILRARREGRFRQVSPYLLLALTVWTVHNLIDIDVYFPSLGVIGAVLLGVLLRNAPAAPQPRLKMGTPIMAALGIVVLVFSAFAMISTELQNRAQAEFEENKLEAAANTLELAKSLMPLNSSLFHDSGDINLNLYHKRHDARYLETATQSFQSAIALSPDKVGPHIGLGLCLSSGNHVGEALDEIRVAERLYPDSTYVQAIARLLEQRMAGTADTPATPTAN